jgi:hypothetical protein
MLVNKLLVFAHEIKLAAKQLTEEDQVLVDDKVKEKVSRELQAYSAFLRKFLQTKGNDEILGKLTPLFQNPRLRKPRNSILLMLEKGDEAAKIGNVADLITELRRILLRYGNMTERYPAVKLLREVLNYGVVNGVPAFKRLLSVERRLYNTFGSQGTLEKDQKQD